MEIVIFTQRVEVVESYDERRDCADQAIPLFIKKCGYIPVPLPNVIDNLYEYIDILKPKGIILTGGNSLIKYGGNAPERDKTDKELIEIALKKKLPLYGFCRGMQSILHYFGCHLSQIQGHVARRHAIINVDGIRLREVNSYHNQACMVPDIKEPIRTLAQTEDGVAEWIRHGTMPIMGTMWHPEREREFSVEDIQMIRELFQ